MKVRCLVELELDAPDLDSVSDLVHETWCAGDPGDTLNACLVVAGEKEVARFSWENEPA